MLSKKDLHDYLEQALELEAHVAGLYAAAARDLEDPDLVLIFDRLRAEEEGHYGWLTRLIALVHEDVPS